MTKRSSVAAVWSAFVGIVAVSLIGWAVYGIAALMIGVIALLFVLGGALFELHRKTRSAIRRLESDLHSLRAERDIVMREIAGIVFLNTRLSPDLPLPPFSGYSIRPDFAERLAGEVLSRKAPTVVELGSGLSTVIMALCLEKMGEGRIVSFDHELAYADATRQMLSERGLEGRATVSVAPLAPWSRDGESRQWYELDQAALPDAIDVLVVDGPPGPLGPLARYPALPALYARLAPGAIVFLDDGRREDEQQIAARWRREFPDFSPVEFPSRSGVIALRKAMP
jgi:predicted O-methyltransferase YrrM